MDDLLNQIIKGHQERKAQLEALEEEHEARVSPLKNEIEQLEAAAHMLLLRGGQKSVRTDNGTAYRQKWTKAKVTDFQAVWAWAKAHDRSDILTKAVNKSVLQEEIERAKEEAGEDYKECPIPGVELEEGYKCNIRRSSK